MTPDTLSRIASEFPDEFPPAWRAVQAVLEAIRGRDLSRLAARSPALRGFEWTAYLECSVVRMTRVLRALAARLPANARILDCGSYFGNFSLMLAEAGYAVDAIDSYGQYAPALEPIVDLLAGHGVGVRELEDGFGAWTDGWYDAVLMMGVVEHVPHTPRPLLEAVDRSLRPGGWLLLDTPNLAYLYNRERFQSGVSVSYPLAAQWETEIPFEGHHREYTLSEVEWMLDRIGHTDRQSDLFNYSYLALATIPPDDARRLERTAADPTMREVIFTVSRRTP